MPPNILNTNLPNNAMAQKSALQSNVKQSNARVQSRVQQSNLPVNNNVMNSAAVGKRNDLIPMTGSIDKNIAKTALPQNPFA